MAIKHSTTKAAGQKLFAAADWNPDHIIDSDVDLGIYKLSAGNTYQAIIGDDANLTGGYFKGTGVGSLGGDVETRIGYYDDAFWHQYFPFYYNDPDFGEYYIDQWGYGNLSVDYAYYSQYPYSLISGTNYSAGTGTGQFGAMGLGVAPSANIILRVVKTLTSSTDYSYGSYFIPTFTPATSQTTYGGYGMAFYPTLSATANNYAYIIGMFFQPVISHIGGAYLPYMAGIQINPYFTSTSAGLIADYYGIKMDNITKHASSTETVNRAYQIYLSQQTKATTNWQIYSVGGNSAFAGNTSLGMVTAPTAKAHLGAGTATASTAPLKFTSGVNLTNPENGTMEYDGTNLYFTTGGTRYKVTLEAV